MSWWSKFMGPTYNYYWDRVDPARPHTQSNVCNALSLVPDNATRIEPPECQEGTIPCWDGKKWIVKLDWRQEKLYKKATGEPTGYPFVDVDMEDLEKNYTSVAPTSQFDIWVDGKWVVDEEAQTAFNAEALNKQRKKLVSMAADEIEVIGDVILYMEDTNDENLPAYAELCKTWRLYRGRLLTMKIVTGKETFPDQPTKLDDFVA